MPTQRNREPSLTEVLDTASTSLSADIKCHLPARVVSFDGKHTVSVEVMINQVVDGKQLPYPILADVPVGFMRAGGFVFTVPISAGDEGMLAFQDRCIDGWFTTGKMSAPVDFRLHDISDATFYPGGIVSQPNALGEVFGSGLSMQTDDGSTFIRVMNGKIHIKGDILHEGNSEQQGNSVQKGQHNQQGSWNQTEGEATSTGTITAAKGVFGGIDVQTHTHGGVETGSGSTDEPNK